VSFCGQKFVHLYGQWAFVPVLIVFIILTGYGSTDSILGPSLTEGSISQPRGQGSFKPATSRTHHPWPCTPICGCHRGICFDVRRVQSEVMISSLTLSRQMVIDGPTGFAQTTVHRETDSANIPQSSDFTLYLRPNSSPTKIFACSYAGFFLGCVSEYPWDCIHAYNLPVIIFRPFFRCWAPPLPSQPLKSQSGTTR
jgi:hypothetical protein